MHISIYSSLSRHLLNASLAPGIGLSPELHSWTILFSALTELPIKKSFQQGRFSFHNHSAQLLLKEKEKIGLVGSVSPMKHIYHSLHFTGREIGPENARVAYLLLGDCIFLSNERGQVPILSQEETEPHYLL